MLTLADGDMGHQACSPNWVHRASFRTLIRYFLDNQAMLLWWFPYRCPNSIITFFFGPHTVSS